MAALGACQKQSDASANGPQRHHSSSKLLGGGRIIPNFAQYYLDSFKTVHAKGHSDWTRFDLRLANRQPFTAKGHYQYRTGTGDVMDYDFRYAAGHLYLRPRDQATAEALIGDSGTKHDLSEAWLKAQPARILGKWVLGVSDNNRINGAVLPLISWSKPFGVFSYNTVGVFHSGDKEWQRSDKTVGGVKVAAFRKPNGEELDLALAGKHRPVRTIYKSNGNKVIHFSGFDAPLHVKAPVNPIDMTKLQ